MQLHTSTKWEVIDRSSTGTTVYAYAYFVFGLFDFYVPVNNLSVTEGRVFLG